jgi:fatty acid desaturase
MSHWTKFKKDKYYLVKYLSLHLLIAAAVVSFQWQFIDLSQLLNFKFQWWQLLLLPVGLIIGVQIPVLIHNCVHNNLKIKILNNIAGEIAGIYVLLSMASFELNHFMHHAHADKDLDPHNPHKRNFFKFFFANNFGGTDVVLSKYLNYHGDTKVNRMLFNLIIFIHFLNVPLRIVFWFLLLGPSLFILAFIPSYLFHMFVFAHINFITHETKADGSTHVYNHDSNYYYQFVNFFGSGVYYHKNHHINPSVYNPKLGVGNSWLLR